MRGEAARTRRSFWRRLLLLLGDAPSQEWHRSFVKGGSVAHCFSCKQWYLGARFREVRQLAENEPRHRFFACARGLMYSLTSAEKNMMNKTRPCVRFSWPETSSFAFSCARGRSLPSAFGLAEVLRWGLANCCRSRLCSRFSQVPFV